MGRFSYHLLCLQKKNIVLEANGPRIVHISVFEVWRKSVILKPEFLFKKYMSTVEELVQKRLRVLCFSVLQAKRRQAHIIHAEMQSKI